MILFRHWYSTISWDNAWNSKFLTYIITMSDWIFCSTRFLYLQIFGIAQTRGCLTSFINVEFIRSDIFVSKRCPNKLGYSQMLSRLWQKRLLDRSLKVLRIIHEAGGPKPTSLLVDGIPPNHFCRSTGSSVFFGTKLCLLVLTQPKRKLSPCW